MENQLPQKHNKSEITLIPSVKAVAIAKKLTEINLLISYKMEGDEIILWAIELDQKLSIDDLKKIPFILDCFKTTHLPYDHSIGIRNIFLALKEVIIDEDGSYRVRSQRFY